MFVSGSLTIRTDTVPITRYGIGTPQNRSHDSPSPIQKEKGGGVLIVLILFTKRLDFKNQKY